MFQGLGPYILNCLASPALEYVAEMNLSLKLLILEGQLVAEISEKYSSSSAVE
jgi:hypothetical protein